MTTIAKSKLFHRLDEKNCRQPRPTICNTIARELLSRRTTQHVPLRTRTIISIKKIAPKTTLHVSTNVDREELISCVVFVPCERHFMKLPHRAPSHARIDAAP